MKVLLLLIFTIFAFSEEKLCSEWNITLSGGEYRKPWFQENYFGYSSYSLNSNGTTNKHILKCTGTGGHRAEFARFGKANMDESRVNKLITQIQKLHRDGSVEGNLIKYSTLRKFKVEWKSACCDELKINIDVFERE